MRKLIMPQDSVTCVGTGLANFEWYRCQKLALSGIFRRVRHPKTAPNSYRRLQELLGSIPTAYHPDSYFVDAANLIGPRGHNLVVILHGQHSLFVELPDGCFVSLRGLWKPWRHNGRGGDLYRIQIIKWEA